MSNAPKYKYCTEELPTIMKTIENSLQLQISKGEDGLLMHALQEHLGRPIAFDDFRDAQMKFFQGGPNEYIFAYKGIDLGIIKREIKLHQKEAWESPMWPNDSYEVEYVVTFAKFNPAPSACPQSARCTTSE